MENSSIILSGNGNKDFSKLVCEHLNKQLFDCDISKFANGEININI